MMIKIILIWFVLITLILNTVYELIQVAQGEHEHIQSAIVSAVSATMLVFIAVLWWIYVIRGSV